MMLKQLEDAAKCGNHECKNCLMYPYQNWRQEVRALAETALAYRAMLERLEYKGIYDTCVYCGCAIGHREDCKLAALLKE